MTHQRPMRNIQTDTKKAIEFWIALSTERKQELLAECEKKLLFFGKEMYDGGRVIEFDLTGQHPERVVSVLTGMNIDSYRQQVYLWPNDARLHL